MPICKKTPHCAQPGTLRSRNLYLALSALVAADGKKKRTKSEVSLTKTKRGMIILEGVTQIHAPKDSNHFESFSFIFLTLVIFTC